MARRVLARGGQNASYRPALLMTLGAEITHLAEQTHGQYRWACGPSKDGSMMQLKLLEEDVDQSLVYQWNTLDIQQTTNRRMKVVEACGTLTETLRLSRHRRSETIESSFKRNTRGDIDMRLIL